MEIKIHSFQKHKRLSLVQFSSQQINSFEYISGAKAIEQNYIEIKEIDSSGSVNNIYLINSSDKYIFFMDGDILIGANQNRTLNSSVLIAPNSKINLPVSCVEQGRWSSISDKFHPSQYITPQKLRANKSKSVEESLRETKSHMAKQSEVWYDVNNYFFSYKMNSLTMNLSELFDRKKDDFEEFLNKFELSQEANGMALFTDNNSLSIDLFNRTDIYQEYFPKLLRSAALEVFRLKDKENPITEAEAIYKTVNLFDNLENFRFEIFPGIGIGQEKRFISNEITGLELNFNNHLIHLTLLNLKN